MKRSVVLILGASGMLGHRLALNLSRNNRYQLHATVRSKNKKLEAMAASNGIQLHEGVNADTGHLLPLFARVKPNLVINCIGLIKQLPSAADALNCIDINARFPHQLLHCCQLLDARLILISTDCVFSGKGGGYDEKDVCDANDLYGLSKRLGEVHDHPNCLTLRTSIIGHELSTRYGLLEWFLSQEARVEGYANAVFSGLTTTEFSRMLDRYVVPNEKLWGLYHVSSQAISKYRLLQLIAQRYEKNIVIEENKAFFCDRSLNGERFSTESSYKAPDWPKMIDDMYKEFQQLKAGGK